VAGSSEAIPRRTAGSYRAKPGVGKAGRRSNHFQMGWWKQDTGRRLGGGDKDVHGAKRLACDWRKARRRGTISITSYRFVIFVMYHGHCSAPWLLIYRVFSILCPTFRRRPRGCRYTTFVGTWWSPNAAGGIVGVFQGCRLPKAVICLYIFQASGCGLMFLASGHD
jgi:hypothetical protein